ncbi:MAG TPA: asparagine synthase (glutamine-hydrolyzing), partial [Phycisphaerae bacterium]|nr:asparagine synthase (glutamine-hydrolyzing) [Phycisphaerae bacterium]
MCGICGIVDFAGSASDHKRRLAPMVQTLEHRGPDDSGIWAEDRAAIGHARLSIIDLDTGAQPLCNEDRTVWIAYNGEIYNFRELHKQLESKGHHFRTRSDTEVIVHLYEQEGIGCVEKLSGMFAFALWDSKIGKMFLVRDRIGIKPLYYTITDGKLIFGSEIKAILASRLVARAVNTEALSDYLTFLYVPEPKTMFRDIYKLQPGWWMSFDSTGPFERQYWDLPIPQVTESSQGQVEEQLIDKLKTSVNERLVSDVPLGAFLSGGVDSSAVVAMMSNAGQKPLVTTSIGFDQDKYNELPYARQVAERYNTQHHEHIVTSDAVSIVEKLSWHYDEPFADYSAIPTYYVSAAARQHVTVALSG